MKSPLAWGTWLTVDSATSTQDIAANLLRMSGEQSSPTVVHAIDQIQGRGRLGRVWVAAPGDSLTFSLVFKGYANHPRPYLIGMTCAVAVAQTFGARLKWPNDVMIDGKKLGGILTEVYQDAQGDSIPIVGIGLNLNQTEFPSGIADTATSVVLAGGQRTEARQAGEAILEAMESLPEPEHWLDLEPFWRPLDATSGRQYLLEDGRLVRGVDIGPEGELIAEFQGERFKVLAAEAIFGR